MEWIALSEKVKSDRYHFMAYHNFPKLNEALWYKGGEKFKLINN